MTSCVLVVDDDPIVRIMIKEYFQMRECRVIDASDGTAGFELAEKNRPQLVIMDIMMPGLEGSAAVKKIQKCGGPSGTPIIIHSGIEEDKLRAMVTLSEKTRFLGKPADLRRLWALASELLKRSGKSA